MFSVQFNSILQSCCDFLTFFFSFSSILLPFIVDSIDMLTLNCSNMKTITRKAVHSICFFLFRLLFWHLCEFVHESVSSFRCYGFIMGIASLATSNFPLQLSSENGNSHFQDEFDHNSFELLRIFQSKENFRFGVCPRRKTFNI